MAPADIIEDGSAFLMVEVAERPIAPPSHFRRGFAVAAAVGLGVIGLVATAAASAAHRAAPEAASPGDDLQMWGQHQCSSCEGGQCSCDWANEVSCSPIARSDSCCWQCCCGQASSAQPSAQPVFVHQHYDHYHYVATHSGVTSCYLHHGDWVHVTGYSGTSYSATVVGSIGDDMFEVEISGRSYRVHATSIDLCSNRPNVFLTTVLPILLIIALVVVVSYLVWKKSKE